MHKTALYTLVNGGIAHQKQQKSVEKKHFAALHCLSVMPRNITFLLI